MKLYLASGNPHKAQEFQQLAEASRGTLRDPLEIYSARDLGGMPAVVEDTGTFVGNARKKAQALFRLVPAGAWALADDSGLCVDHLGGGPGVESAYYAGPAGDAVANLTRLVQVMRGVPAPARRAHFFCVLFLVGPGREERSFEGSCAGRLLPEPAGGAGFGYDPLFVPEGCEESFAQLGEAVKARLSHRALAWRALVSDLLRREARGAGTSSGGG